MTLATIIVLGAILALVLIVRIAVSRSLQTSDRASLAQQIQPVDVEAFRNLVNPAEENYLQSRLTSSQYRLVRYARLRATGAYVREAGRNAALLVRIGEAALATGDLKTLKAARDLTNDALLLRRNALLASIRIYIALAWPNSDLGAGRIVESYVHLNGSAMLLGRLQNPGAAVRL